MSRSQSKIRSYFNSSIAVIMLRLIGQTLLGYYRLAKLRRNHPSLELDMPIKISFDRNEALRLGKNIYIGAFSEIVVLESTTFSPIKGSLEIGDRVIIGKGANIRAAGGQIIIGENALLAQDVSLIAANHLLTTAIPYRDQPWDSNRFGVTVGRNVWIGAGVTVLPGVDIGERIQ
jgi:acetyltransferase-like isoleucine patch superfamily enzyme